MDGPSQQTLRELSERVGISKNTTFRLLRTLEEAGYVRQDLVTKRYQLSLKVLDLEDASLRALGYPEEAQPYLEELNDALGESVNLAVLEGDRVRYVARVASKRIMMVNLHVGATLPAHATSLGKVLLASLPLARLREIYSGHPLEAFTAHTITSIDRLLRELATVRDQGYAVNEEELEIGLRSVAAPVHDRLGNVIAAVNVSTAVVRVSRKSLVEEILPQLLHTTAAISARLGYRPAAAASLPAPAARRTLRNAARAGAPARRVGRRSPRRKA